LNIAYAVIKTRGTLFLAKPLSIRALRKVRASFQEYSWTLLLPATSLRYLEALSAAALKNYPFPAFFCFRQILSAASIEMFSVLSATAFERSLLFESIDFPGISALAKRN
jgi:hypothetical protein